MKRFLRFLSCLSDILNKIIEYICVFLLIALSALMVLAVFYRYALNDSIYWSNEAARILLLFVSFLGSSIAYKHKAHIGVDVFVEKMTQKNRNRLDFIIKMSFFIFWCIIFVESFKLMPLFLMQTTATLEIPYAYIFSVIPISAFVWLVHTSKDMLIFFVGDK